jgi:hypothetical protein
MIRWQRLSQQLLKLSAGQPHEGIVGDGINTRSKVPSTPGASLAKRLLRGAASAVVGTLTASD